MTGEEWVAAFCEARKLDWDKLSFGEQREITRLIPCSVRCWRVGGPVDTPPGNPCDECGRPVPLPDLFERLQGEPLL